MNLNSKIDNEVCVFNKRLNKIESGLTTGLWILIMKVKKK